MKIWILTGKSMNLWFIAVYPNSLNDWILDPIIQGILVVCIFP